MRPVNDDYHDYAYFKILNAIKDSNPQVKENRTATPTVGIIGHLSKYPMASFYKPDGTFQVDNFPLLTSKKVNFRSILAELIWFINGQTNIRFLEQLGVKIWTQWPHKYYNQQNPNDQKTLEEFRKLIIEDYDFAMAYGELGPVYGSQWRAWQTPKGPIDQFAKMLDTVLNKSSSRRNIVTAWNPAEIEEMEVSGLPPCHTLWQVSVIPQENNHRLIDLSLTQRSADTFLGVPYNIASYALLTAAIAEYSGSATGTFNHFMIDTHIYVNHLEQIEEQLSREPYMSPQLVIKPDFLKTLMEVPIASDDLDFHQFAQYVELKDYNHHAYLAGDVAV